MQTTPGLSAASQGAPVSSGLKSWFVMPFLAVQVWIAAQATGALWSYGFSLGWTGALVSAGSFLVFLGGVVLRDRARTSSNVPWVLALSGLGAGAAFTAAAMGEPSAQPALYATTAFGGVLLYVFWYSRFGRQPAPALAAGAELPNFVAETAEGRPVRASAFRGAPALFLFYRGNWCPLCMAQIREIAAQYQQLADRGVEAVLISPQPHEQTRRLAERFEVPFHFLVDRDLRAAKMLGIEHLRGVPAGMNVLGYEPDTVLPTAVLVDAEGRILWCDQTDNYRVRPEPQTFLRVLDEAREPAPT